MQYLLFGVTCLSFLLAFYLFCKSRKKTVVIKNKLSVGGVKSPNIFGFKVTIFKSEFATLFCFENNVFTLSLNDGNFVSIKVFEGEDEIIHKVNNNKDFAEFAGNSIKLCVKHDFMQILCNMHSTIKIEIQKGKIPFCVDTSGKTVKFENFKLVFSADTKSKNKIFDDKIIFVFCGGTCINLNYATLKLRNISQKENRQISVENFGKPKINFPLPNFSCLGENSPAGIYATKCFNARYILTPQPRGNRLNLSRLGFSRWVSTKKYGEKITIKDILTNYKIYVKTKAKTFFISVWWGEIFLCLDSEYELIFPFNKVGKEEVNLFKFKYNWKLFPSNLKFDFAFDMLKFMNKTGDSHYLKNRYIAQFIYECLPKDLPHNKKYYNFVRQLYPFVKHKKLKEKLLLYMQNCEQMFYNSYNL